jgi:hypothetical protein
VLSSVQEAARRQGVEREGGRVGDREGGREKVGWSGEEAVKNIFGFRRKSREPLGFSTGPQTTCLSFGRQIQRADSLRVHKYLAGYKPAGKIYKAASKGNVAKVQQMLLCGENGLNGKDKKNK